MLRIEINTDEAVKLWKSGWCWNALGDKYGCSGETVKSRFSIDDKNKFDLQQRHNHFKNCPKCHKHKTDNQISLL